jgi:hypothetical protein
MLLKCCYGFLHLWNVVPAVIDCLHVCLNRGGMIDEPLGYGRGRADLAINAAVRTLSGLLWERRIQPRPQNQHNDIRRACGLIASWKCLDAIIASCSHR